VAGRHPRCFFAPQLFVTAGNFTIIAQRAALPDNFEAAASSGYRFAVRQVNVASLQRKSSYSAIGSRSVVNRYVIDIFA